MSRRRSPRAAGGTAPRKRGGAPAASAGGERGGRNGGGVSPGRRLLAALAVAAGAALLWLVLWQTGALNGEPSGEGEPSGAGEPQAGAAAPAEGETGSPPAASPPADAVRELAVRVVATYPHDPTAFTQGLLLDGGRLFESTGRYGYSTVRQVDVESGEVVRQSELSSTLFGEGLALVPGDGGARLVQITWQEGRALVWDAATLEPRGEHRYTGEGWGLCYDAAGQRLVMSDGSPRLTFRDPRSFEETGAVAVSLRGRPLGNLNELECVGGRVYANVFTTEFLVEIDPSDGRVTAVIDASGLMAAGERWGTDVLNGIAHDPRDGTFLLTGKLWPKLFRVELVPAG